MTCVTDFVPDNVQLAVPFCSQFRVRHGTEQTDGQTTAINALCPTYRGGA